MLRIIVGRSGTGKSYRVLKEMAKFYDLKKTEKLMLLVPEQYTLEASADFIEKMGHKGHIHLDVLSFKRLAHRVFEQTGMENRVQISPLGKTMLLRRIFNNESGNLQVYGRMAGRTGFLDTFNTLIAEMKKAQISAEDIERQIERMEDCLLKKKMEDISILYRAFGAQMSDAYFDDEDMLELLIEKMDEAYFLKSSKIWIDNFNSFTAQEYAVLEKLVLNGQTVTVALTYDPNGRTADLDLFNTTQRTLARLMKIAADNNVEIKRYKLEDTPSDLPIEHLSRTLFAYKSNPYKRPANRENRNALQFWMSQSRHVEIERVGRAIVELARSSHYDWRNIAVVTPDIGDYAMHIKRSFAAMDIPYFLDEKRSILNSPLIQYILGLLRFFAYGYKQEDAIRILKTGLTVMDIEDIHAFENYILAYGVKKQVWWKPFVHINKKLENPEKALEKMESLRLMFIEPLLNLKNCFKGIKDIRTLSAALFDHLDKSGVFSKFEAFTTELKAAGLLDYAHESAQIWNAVIEILDQLVELLGEEKVKLAEYIKLLETGFSSTEIGIIPPARDCVLVGSLERSRLHDIKALFIIGMNDGKLPKVSEASGILSDGDKLFLKEAGLQINSDMQTVSEEEQLSLYQAIRKPSQQLILSCVLSDSEGKGMRPSIYFERAQKLFQNWKVQYDYGAHRGRIASENLKYISTPEATMQVLIEQNRQLLDTDQKDEFWETVTQWYKDRTDWAWRYELVEMGYAHNNQVNPIGRSLAKQLYGVPLKSSVSRFEKYVQCPFAHFVSYGLKPEERKLYTIELPDLGTIYHASIEKFSHEMERENIQWKALTREDCERLIDQIVDDVAGAYGNQIFESSDRYKYLIKRIKRVGRRAAWTIADQIRTGQFKPEAFELAFEENGGPDTVPPILLELPDGETILLEGRVDRIDIYDDGETKHVKIVDYKSGSRRFNLSDAYNGLQIQLVVYLDAVMKHAHYFKTDTLYPGGMFYFKIDDPLVEASEYNPEKIEIQIRQALRMDGLAVRDVKVVQALDETLEPGQKSEVVPVELKKDGDISSRSSTVEVEDFKLLIEHVRHLMVEVGQEIINGTIKIEPCKFSGITSCDYCPYKGICQFDQLFENNKFRYIHKKKDEDVLNEIRMNKEGEHA